MAKATCSVCQGTYDSRSMRSCPSCSAYICPVCEQDTGGFCNECAREE